MCCAMPGLTGLACTYPFVHNNISSSIHPHEYEHTHNTEKDCDPCTWQPWPPVRVNAPRKTIAKFPSKLKHGHESQLSGSRPRRTDRLSVIKWRDLAWRDSSDSIATRLRAGRSGVLGFDSQWELVIFSPSHPERLWGPHSLLSNG
jgi:hypothetical protein